MKRTTVWAATVLAASGLIATGLAATAPDEGNAAKPPTARHTKPPRPTPTPTPTPSPTPAGGHAVPTKVLTVVEENHSYTQATAGMPYLMGLASQYAYASAWSAVAHPSLPNYLGIVGGDTFGVSSDTEAVPSPKVGGAASVFGQARATGKTAKTYADSMPASCSTAPSGEYAPKHNPWVYFGAEARTCQQFDVPESGFLTDAISNALPNAGMLVPNLCNDAHDCSLATADNWLKERLPTVLSSTDFTSGRLTVVVTFDEDDNTSANQVLTVVMNAGMTKHGQVMTPLSHYSLTGYYDRVLGTPLLRKATPDLAGAFGLG